MSYMKIPGWMAPEFEAFYEVMAERLTSDSRVVEIGCAYGRSIAFLVERLIDLDKQPVIFAVDPWEEFMGGEQADKAEFVACMKRNHKTPYEAFEANLREFRPEALELVTAIRETSVEASHHFFVNTLDFVMIDARHEYSNVRDDIRAWLPLVKPGGIIAGDDYDAAMFPGLVRAVDEAAAAGMAIETSGRIWFHEVPR